MNTYTQAIEENIAYEQSISGVDPITSATWTVDNGGVLTSQAFSATKASVNFSASVAGRYLLQVTLVLSSGQIRIGQANIGVVENLV